jgi:GH18 family chitinase
MFTKALLVVALFCAVNLINADGTSKVVCHYNSKSFIREGLGKLTVADVEPALSFCTHLVYEFAGINSADNKLTSLDVGLDLDQGKGHYRIITQLKRKFPGLKVLLSVGGGNDIDPDVDTNKYLTLLESMGARSAFINSAYSLVKTYDFDGINLAWQFPPNKPKKIRSSIGSLWSGFKHSIGIGNNPVDEKADEHKEEFTSFVRELKNAFRHENYVLSLTVLPNVNSTFFFDIPAIINNIDYVVLPSFDFQTPARNRKEADYSAPLYELNDRIKESNVNYQVLYWLGQHAPASKLIVGIPTFGRTWKLEQDATQTGVPPILGISEAGPEGIQSKTAGLLSYPEICAKLPNPSNNNLKGENAPLRKVGDPTKRFGTYAYRLADSDGNFGLWVSYEDPDTAGNKAGYVRAKGLGGISINDLSLDDFRGTCSGDKYPILRAAKYRL